ncbi:TNT domain-containing protein [Streptomyces ficellus]|uniref:TNT domain-containing protein n=1 Tax=Streptomyces ficellus TaxID=1977088 RepID=A0ABT7Z6Q5_9ACTN|nr:TNT domain-containing protein [Streptomyces ficellus]MDN3295170.1 TNT domain-containing protein [Streptomyces ficellus]
MNRLRAVLSALALTVAALSAPTPAVAAPADDTRRQRPAVCSGEFQGDARLGPKYLPRPSEHPVGPLLKGYKRTGGLSPKAFLATYWKEEGPGGPAGWKYPPNDGFAEVNGRVDKHVEILQPGEVLDRFGSEYGSYLAPAGDAYAKRALPPQNLNTREPAFPCDYRRYTVKRPFPVWEGGIAPWFAQPGGGRQIKLDAALLNPGQGERLNVKWLLAEGYLAPATRSSR